ncbi:MAG TPA: 23S rRNA (guanosine(2251)-2'-O)-methyltransferase RlmB [Spirochaetota bacterium]|nr:23S rRNA (guanosine(2251)-2'-O)-methyltransferase RlmB [Spirochaetota bacterium]HPH01360.1 23S rRNA (guanosine(2251)-2'-O)-methyltransferase RlmB [Spirochaetota bacterium]HPN83288.1 23S rRNA (guanosine(2251)-2'-O)-methyltransferase RlmB [Spirochaetota bacterium]
MKKTLIYGKNAVLEYLKTCRRPVGGRLLLARGNEGGAGKLMQDLAVKLGIVCLSGPRRELDQLYPGLVHQGFVLELGQKGKAPGRVPDGRAQARPPKAPRPAVEAREDRETEEEEIRLEPLPEDIVHWDWERELAAAVERGEWPRVLVLDHVQDPGNLGAVVRSAAQFGVSCVIIPKDGASGMTPVARKAACGGDCHVPVITETNLVRVLERLKEMGFWSAAAVGSDGKPVREFAFDSPFVVVLGSEGAGIRRLLLERCDWKLTIPMLPRLDSLNVSVSAGIILHEMFSKRKILE